MRIGVDLGGTKIEAVALSDAGDIIERQRVATPSGDYGATIQAVTGLVKGIEATIGQQATVGVGTPGAIDPACGLLKNSNSVCLNGQPVKKDLEAALAREVRMANDADCFALSEAVDGAAKGASSVFGVIVGTGTGAGVVVRGQLLSGPNAIAGEWGHNPLPWMRPDEFPGEQCYCGKLGCVETFLAGPWLAKDHQRVTGEAINAVTIASRAAQGDSAAQATLERYADRMARALAGIINVLDPEVVVLGGGLSQISWLYDEVPKRWGQYVFAAGVEGVPVATRLVPPVHGDSSGVRGAAWLWPSNKS